MTSHLESQVARCPCACPQVALPGHQDPCPPLFPLRSSDHSEVTPPHSSKGGQQGSGGRPSRVAPACMSLEGLPPHWTEGWGSGRGGPAACTRCGQQQTDKSLFNQSERAWDHLERHTRRGIKSAPGVLGYDLEDKGVVDTATQVSCSPVQKEKETDAAFFK